MKQHKHLFKAKSVEIIEQDEKEVMEQMFGMKMPPLPKGKTWGKEKTMVTKFECKYGATQEVHDTPEGEWSKTLPDEFISRGKSK